MAAEKTTTSLWDQRRVVRVPDRPYAAIRRQLLDTMKQGKKTSHITKRKDGKGYLFRALNHTKKLGQVTLDIETNASFTELQVAVSYTENDVRHQYFYNITDAGYAVDVDSLSSTVEEWPPLLSHLKHAYAFLEGEVEVERRQAREERTNAIVSYAIIAGVIIGIVTIVWLFVIWIRVGIIEPREANSRARVEYDATNPQLEGRGYPVGTYRLGNLPDDTFSTIPTLGDEDKNLSHPRTITLYYDSTTKWCKSLAVDVPSGSSVIAAVPETSPFNHDNYTAVYANGKLSVCVTGGFSATHDSQNVRSLELALQVKPQQG